MQLAILKKQKYYADLLKIKFGHLFEKTDDVNELCTSIENIKDYQKLYQKLYYTNNKIHAQHKKKSHRKLYKKPKKIIQCPDIEDNEMMMIF